MSCLSMIAGVLVFLGFAGWGVTGVVTEPVPAPFPPEAEQVEIEPPAMDMLQGDTFVAMDQGSYCWSTAASGVCVDKMPPSYAPESHVLLQAGTLELLIGGQLPDTLSVSLYPGSTLEGQESIAADAEMDENGRVMVTLPDGLSGDYVLAVFATWTEGGPGFGDAFYTIPVRFE
jgi:hypothetical protein